MCTHRPRQMTLLSPKGCENPGEVRAWKQCTLLWVFWVAKWGAFPHPGQVGTLGWLVTSGRISLRVLPLKSPLRLEGPPPQLKAAGF